MTIEDLINRLKKHCSYAVLAAKKFNAKRFYLQTNLSKKDILEFEDFENTLIERAVSLKNLINQKAIELIKKDSDLVLDQIDPEILINIDLINDKVVVRHSNIYIYVRYLKKTREYAQHVWACPSCKGKGCKKCNYTKEKYPSIESAFKEIFVKEFGASDCILHASGREDVDVMTLGHGRPAVIEIVNPTKTTSDLELIAQKIKQNYPLEILQPKIVKKFWIEAICNSHFDKKYYAIVSSKTKELTKNDFELLKNSCPILLKQRTPLRVLKRRTDMIRERYILDLKLEKIEDKKLHLIIYAQAGTYIKEFISGDGGRTHPSVSSILKTECSCEELTLIDVNDFFVNTLKS